MMPIPFSRKERVLAPAAGTHDEVQGLRVVDVTYDDGTHAMVSCWEVTDAELELIKRSKRVYVAVMGSQHPPIALSGKYEHFGLVVEQ